MSNHTVKEEISTLDGHIGRWAGMGQEMFAKGHKWTSLTRAKYSATRGFYLNDLEEEEFDCLYEGEAPKSRELRCQQLAEIAKLFGKNLTSEDVKAAASRICEMHPHVHFSWTGRVEADARSYQVFCLWDVVTDAAWLLDRTPADIDWDAFAKLLPEIAHEDEELKTIVAAAVEALS